MKIGLAFNMKKLEIVFLLMFFSCASNPEKHNDDKQFSNSSMPKVVEQYINYESTHKNSTNLDDPERDALRYRATVELLDAAYLSLNNKDTPRALRYLVVARDISPYHGRVKILYC